MLAVKLEGLQPKPPGKQHLKQAPRVWGWEGGRGKNMRRGRKGWKVNKLKTGFEAKKKKRQSQPNQYSSSFSFGKERHAEMGLLLLEEAGDVERVQPQHSPSLAAGGLQQGSGLFFPHT